MSHTPTLHPANLRTPVVYLVLFASLLAASLAALSWGEAHYSWAEITAVLRGETVPGASFVVGELRLPRLLAGALCGLALGTAGAAFQTLLSNPLASPDVLGISTGASLAAVLGIVTWGLGRTGVSVLALAGALGTAAVIAWCARGPRSTGAAGYTDRLILIGIAVAALVEAGVAYVIVRASPWDLQTAMRWLTGSLNGVAWPQVTPLAVVASLLVPLLWFAGRSLRIVSLGEDLATGLGVRVRSLRAVVLLSAVTLLALATAAAGPIAFVSFLAGPVALRLAPRARAVLPLAGLVGATLVVTADLFAQHALGVAYPVGVVTGALGAPFLLVLLLRSQQPKV